MSNQPLLLLTPDELGRYLFLMATTPRYVTAAACAEMLSSLGISTSEAACREGLEALVALGHTVQGEIPNPHGGALVSVWGLPPVLLGNRDVQTGPRLVVPE